MPIDNDMTYFIDPPYMVQSHGFTHRNVDYVRLKEIIDKLNTQVIVCGNESDNWIKLADQQAKDSDEYLMLVRINQAVKEYLRRGTPVNVIKTFNISESKKAEIYDAVMMRVKGRLGKSNPWKR